MIEKLVARRALPRKTTAMVVDIAAVTAAETAAVAAAIAFVGRTATASPNFRRWAPRQGSRPAVDEAHLGNVVVAMSGNKTKDVMTGRPSF